METKKCNKCGIVKNVSDFHRESRSKNGYKPRCKECTNEYYKSLYPSFRTKKLDQQKTYYLKNSDSIKIKVREYSIKNIDAILSRKMKYVESNRVKIKQYRNEYTKNRNITDGEFHTNRVIRSFIYRLLICKTDKTENILGYSVKDLHEKLGRYPNTNESIDHKIPISWFTSKADIRIVHNLENLQIVTKSNNSKKSNIFCDSINEAYYKIAINSIKPKYQHLLKTPQNGN
jgi:hypothetical protein